MGQTDRPGCDAPGVFAAPNLNPQYYGDVPCFADPDVKKKDLSGGCAAHDPVVSCESRVITHLKKCWAVLGKISGKIESGHALNPGTGLRN